MDNEVGRKLASYISPKVLFKKKLQLQIINHKDD